MRTALAHNENYNGVDEPTPKTWQDYEEEYKAAKVVAAGMSKQSKDRIVRSKLLGSNNKPSRAGFEKVGQQFVGPILVRLKYEGVTRDLLVEKPLAQGELPIFPQFDHIGYAFVLNDYAGEVQAIRMEAKRFEVPLFRIAHRAIVPKGEVYSFSFDLVERTKQQMLENIMRKEDQHYYANVELAIQGYADAELGPEYYNYPDPATEYSIDVTGAFTHMSYTNAFRVVSQAQLFPSRIVNNVGDYFDVFNWGVNTIGYAAVERITDTGAMPNYGPAQFKPTVTTPKGVAYVQPDPEYVGFLPVRYSPQVAEVHAPERGEYGWVIDEMVGYAIANARGLVKLRKI